MKRFTLDLREADGYVVTEDALIRNVFRREGVMKNDTFLYTVVDGDIIDHLEKKGTYRDGDNIFAFDHNELVIHNEDGNHDLDTALASYENPAIAVYRKSHFNPTELHFEYQFNDPSKKPDALEAIVEVTW